MHIVLCDEKRDSDNEDLFHRLSLEEWSYYYEPDKPFKSVSREEFERHREERQRRVRRASPASHIWQIDTLEGTHIGWVNCYHLDEQAKWAYVGVCLPEDQMWDRGYGTEAVCLLVDHLFGGMGLEEVRGATWTGNRRMTRCAENSGFREVVRTPYETEYSVRGEPLERIEFSMCREEWLAQRGGGC